MRFLACSIWIVVVVAGCAEDTGPPPRDGYRMERVSYEKRRFQGVEVFRVAAIQLTEPVGAVAAITGPQRIGPSQPLVMEGAITVADPGITVRSVRLEHYFGDSKHLDNYSGGASEQAIRQKDQFLFRIDFRAPQRKGRHRVRLSATMTTSSGEWVTVENIAEGDLRVE